jgi:hypothetical protein
MFFFSFFFINPSDFSGSEGDQRRVGTDVDDGAIDDLGAVSSDVVQASQDD